MIFSSKFVSATLEKSTTQKNAPAPYLRRDIVLDKLPEKTEITVCGLGFYELYVNGKKITKGHLAPYIVNPDQVLPYDHYDVSDLMVYGENTFAFARDLYFRGGDMRRTGSAALDICGLAAGRNDVFCELILSPWDYAAGSLIVSEAGGYIAQTDGSPLAFDPPCPVLGGTPRVWEELLQMASKYV